MDLKIFKNKRALRFSTIVLVLILMFLSYLTYFLHNRAILSEKLSQSFLASTESIKHLASLESYVNASQLRILNATNYNGVENYKFYLAYSSRVDGFVAQIENNQMRYLTEDFESGIGALTDELRSHLSLIEVIYQDYIDVIEQDMLVVEKEAIFSSSMMQTLEKIEVSLINENAYQGSQSVALARLQKERLSIASLVLIFFMFSCAFTLIYLIYAYTLSQYHLRALYRQSEHPIITLNKDGKIIQFNDKASKLFAAHEVERNSTHARDVFGFQWEEIKKKLSGHQNKTNKRNVTSKNIKTNTKVSANNDRIEHEITVNTENNEKLHYKLSIIVIHTLRTYRAVITFVDQTQLLSIEDKTQKDTFTNLTNKIGILNQLSSEIERAKRHNTALSVVFIDIDGFKGINDRYGHQFGDKVIKWVAKRISNRVRDTDFLGRFGGDEFILVCPDCRASQADSIAEDIRKLLKSPKLHIKASIGVAEMSPRDTRTSLLNRADKALYHAKNSGKDMVVVSN